MRTLEDFIQKGHTVIAFAPRYHSAKVAVLISGMIGPTGQMADAMTDGGDHISHINSMIYGTPYFPFGTGETVAEAMASAINRFATATFDFDEDTVDEAMIHVYNAAANYVNGQYHKKYIDFPNLPSLASIAQSHRESRARDEEEDKISS